MSAKTEKIEALIAKYRAEIAACRPNGDVIPETCNGSRHCVLVNVAFELEAVLRELKEKETPAA
jgi:hypothetical protein